MTKIDFTSIKGKFIVYLNDGRGVIIPNSYFPAIGKLPLEKRKKYWLLEGQDIAFQDPNFIETYSLEDILDVKYKSKKKYVDFPLPLEKPAKKKVTATKKATPKKATASSKK